MKTPAPSRRDRLRVMLADLNMPGALQADDDILSQADSGAITAAKYIEQLLNAGIVLRNNRRLQTAMRSSRLPAVKTLDQFDFAFQPSIKREQIESLHEFGFVDRAGNVILLGPTGPGIACPPCWTTPFGLFLPGPSGKRAGPDADVGLRARGVRHQRQRGGSKAPLAEGTARYGFAAFGDRIA